LGKPKGSKNKIRRAKTSPDQLPKEAMLAGTTQQDFDFSRSNNVSHYSKRQRLDDTLVSIYEASERWPFATGISQPLHI
jgi:hypothetical protein